MVFYFSLIRLNWNEKKMSKLRSVKQKSTNNSIWRFSIFPKIREGRPWAARPFFSCWLSREKWEKEKTQIRPQVRRMLSRPARRGLAASTLYVYWTVQWRWWMKLFTLAREKFTCGRLYFSPSLFYFQKIYSHFTNPLENVLKFYLNELIERSLICDFLKEF